MVVPESAEVSRYRMRRAGRFAVLVLLLSTIIVGILSAKPTTTSANACPAGQVASVSKYVGNTCMKAPSKESEIVKHTVVGCVLGAFAGTLPGLLGGCAVGAVGSI